MTFLDRKSMPPLIAIVFLFMILSRLTWMQLRHYPIEMLGFLGPDILNFKHLQIPEARSWNINTIIVLFFLSAHAVRFLSGSWLTALVATTVLMSRGVVLARVGWLSMDLTLSMLVVAWLTCLAHYLRTASNWSRYASWPILFAGSVLEPSFCVAGLLLAIYRFWITARNNTLLRGEAIPRGNVLRTLPVTFEEWLRSRANPNRDSIAELFIFLCTVVFLVYVRGEIPNYAFEANTQQTIFSFLDFHFVGSLVLIASCAIYGFRKNVSFLNFQSLFLALLLLWIVSSSVWSFLDARHFYFKAVLLWMEPMIVSLACACGIYILKEMKILFDQRNWMRRVSKDYD